MLNACGTDKETEVFFQSERAPVELSAQVDRAVVNPGDIITFTLTADYQQDVSLELPEVADKFSDFRIVNSGISAPARRGERLVAERWYKLQADIAGSYVVEPIEITCRLPGGPQQTVQTPKIFLEVESLLAKQDEANDIRDIKPPVSVSPSYRVLLVILGILAATVLILLLIRKLVEKRAIKAETERLSATHAHEEALEAIDKLLREGLIEKGRAREFCFRISEIFRRYMQARFGIPAIDLTTDEILPRVEDNGIVGDNLKPVVRDFLLSTDLVKFAKYQPTRDEIRKIIENTRIFVETTKMTEDTGIESVSASGGGKR